MLPMKTHITASTNNTSIPFRTGARDVLVIRVVVPTSPSPNPKKRTLSLYDDLPVSPSSKRRIPSNKQHCFDPSSFPSVLKCAMLDSSGRFRPYVPPPLLPCLWSRRPARQLGLPGASCEEEILPSPSLPSTTERRREGGGREGEKRRRV